jgi:hypothetical protein
MKLDYFRYIPGMYALLWQEHFEAIDRSRRSKMT